MTGVKFRIISSEIKEKAYVIEKSIRCIALLITMCVPCYAQQWQNTTANLAGIQVDQDYFYLQGYLIEDHYYFKLQDVSYIMNSSQKPFMVQWQEADRSIHLYSGHNTCLLYTSLQSIKYNNGSKHKPKGGMEYEQYS